MSRAVLDEIKSGRMSTNSEPSHKEGNSQPRTTRTWHAFQAIHDFLFSKYLQTFVDIINLDKQTDSSMNGFETVEILVVYTGVMCFNPIPGFTPLGIYKATSLAKVAHSTKLFIYIWEANFKSLFLFIILKKVTLYSFVPDHRSFNVKLKINYLNKEF